MTPTSTAPLHTTKPAQGPRGERVHPAHLEQLTRLQKQLYPVGTRAWCLVGNGLSNQTFVEAPEGLIAIDTGESVEEMRAALKAVQAVSDKPVVACIYSHFHHVNGTQALLEQESATGLEIYGHAGISDNLARFAGEIAPRANRDLIYQFGVMLPDSGSDALSHCGLGRFYRNPEHAPFTPGYLPAQHTFTTEVELQIAGLTTVMTPAPADATDSITIWFPELGLCVNNLVWPALFNIYAIRGEEYRDPRVWLNGIDHIRALDPQQLVGTHGPPLNGSAVAPALTDYRDALQFIWDQTVRNINLGLSLSEVVAAVQLPERFNRTYMTQQFYGVVEHHVRQIHGGLCGWFDEDESQLFPIPSPVRSARLINGFGGSDEVARQRDLALHEGDLRWACELGTWLVRSEFSTPTHCERLAAILRAMAQHTPVANIRNWCLTRALTLEGALDLSSHQVHRFPVHQVMRLPPERSVATLRVLLNPDRAAHLDGVLKWVFANGTICSLTLRGPVAVPGEDANAALGIYVSHETWAAILGGKLLFWDAVEAGTVALDGDVQSIRTILDAFDHAALRSDR